MSGLKLKLYLILYYISKSSINLECLSKIQIHSPQVTSTKSVSVIQELFKTNLCINSSAVPGLNPPAMQETSWIRRIRWRRDRLPTPVFLGFPCGSASKESACNEGNMGSIAGLGTSREGKGYPLQYSGLENSMDCIVHGVTKSWTWLSNFHFIKQSMDEEKNQRGNLKNTMIQMKIKTKMSKIYWMQ